MNQTVQHRAGGARQIVRHLFVREVDLGLDERQGVEEIAAEAGVGFAQPPVELAQGLFRLGGRLGVDQVGYGLGLSPAAGTVITLLVLVLIGLEASSLRRWTLARNGRPARDAVVAFNADEAEAKAMTRWLDPARTPSVRTSTEFAGARAVEPVIGLFPAQGGR